MLKQSVINRSCTTNDIEKISSTILANLQQKYDIDDD